MTATKQQFAIVLESADDERTGSVFKLLGLDSGKPITLQRISRIVSAIGKRAGVVVNPSTSKAASAHDLRRSFGSR